MKKNIKYIVLSGIIILILLIASFQYSRSWENGLFLRPLYRLDTQEKVVALTFDDGPSETRTPALLELLQEHDVTATFFMLGENIEKYPQIAHQVFTDGHLIGNHSYDHPRLIFKSPGFMSEQVSKTNLLIKSTGQEETKYFRPPYSSKFIILPLVLIFKGMNLVTGTYDPPVEYLTPYSSDEVADEVVENTQPGSIIYLHDGKDGDLDEFIESVELIIIGLKEQGYRFVRLDYNSN